jgi:hypothetical protein
MKPARKILPAILVLCLLTCIFAPRAAAQGKAPQQPNPAAQGKPAQPQNPAAQSAQQTSTSGVANNPDQNQPKGDLPPLTDTKKPPKEQTKTTTAGGQNQGQGSPVTNPETDMSEFLHKVKYVWAGVVIAFALAGMFAWGRLLTDFRQFYGVQGRALGFAAEAWLFMFALAAPATLTHTVLLVKLRDMGVGEPYSTWLTVTVYPVVATAFSVTAAFLLTKFFGLIKADSHPEEEGEVWKGLLYDRLSNRCNTARREVLESIISAYEWDVVQHSVHQLVHEGLVMHRLRSKEADGLLHEVDEVSVSGNVFKDRDNKYKALLDVAKRVPIGDLRHCVARNAREIRARA